MSKINFSLNKNGIGLLELNRPEALNAFNRELLTELSLKLDELSNNDSIRALIITGAGEKAFSSGVDLKALQTFKSIEDARDFALLLEGTSEKIFNFAMPVIAAINGFALGGGMGYAAAADYRLIADTAKVGFPAIKLGAILPVTCTLYLKELIGMSHSRDILLTGRMLDAKQAKEINLVNEIVEKNRLIERAFELAETIIEGSNEALRYTKKTLNSLLATSIESQKLYAADNFAFLSQTEEWKKRIFNFGKK
jgi:enoyl-CoA hydratase